VEILETPEERRPISEPTGEEPATGEACAETTIATRTAEIASEDMSISQVDSLVSPTIEVPSAETIAAGVTSCMENVSAAMISTRVTTVDT